MNPTLQLILIGELGVLVHSLVKAKNLQKDYFAANETFSFYKDYISKEWLGVILAVISPVVWLFIYKEAAAKWDYITGWTNLTFIMAGMAGSWGLQLLDSKSKKVIRKIVDDKTNELDDIKKDQ